MEQEGRKIGRSVFLFGVAIVLIVASCAGGDRGARSATPEACTEFRVGYDMTVTDFGVDAEARPAFAAFAQAVGDYVAVSTKTLEDVTAACRGIALDLGAREDDRGLRGRTGEEASYAWCNLAVRKLQRELTSTLQPAGRLTYAFSPATCAVDEPYVARCEAACSTDAGCEEEREEKRVLVRCKPAQTSGICRATCTGACLGSPVAPSLCEGACDGRCEGTCAGDCVGMCGATPQYAGGKCKGTCNGVCRGACSGRCAGRCQLAKTSSGKCDGPCEGGCSVPLEAPRCDADLEPPSCAIRPGCEASCKASGQARASCSAPAVAIGAKDDFEGALPILAEMRSLETNLSVLFSVARARGPLLEAEARAAYEAGEGIAGSAPAQSPKAKACARAVLAAGEQSLQNVHVAVQASKSVLSALPLED